MEGTFVTYSEVGGGRGGAVELLKGGGDVVEEEGWL